MCMMVLGYSAKSVNIGGGGPLDATGRVSTENFTNMVDRSTSFLSSSSTSLQKVKEGIRIDIADGPSQFSIDGQRLHNLINSNEY